MKRRSEATSADIIESLKAKWYRFGFHDRHEAVFWDVVNRYGETHRRYHDLYHLYDVLNHVDHLIRAEETLQAPWTELVRFAAWFHDAIYDPSATDNEYQSALLAERAFLCCSALGASYAGKVFSLVMATRGHTDGSNLMSKIIIDADLSGLGGPDYDVSEVLIREEYGVFDDEQWREGRKKFLSSFLARDRIFLTQTYHDEREATARANMERELMSLA